MVILAKTGTFYVVKAPLAVAEEIAHLQAGGNAAFSMALRPDVDTRPVDASALGTDDEPLIIRVRPADPGGLPARRRARSRHRAPTPGADPGADRRRAGVAPTSPSASSAP